MKPFETYVKEWEKNAAKDAYWAVLTSSQYEQKEWDKEIFFQSGQQEIARLIEYIQKIPLQIDLSGNALDFGCGTGRLTQALSGRFTRVYGVDVSANMVEKARAALLPSMKNIELLHNPATNLRLFKDETFNFIYSNIVMQHIALRHQMQYLEEFARVLKKGAWLVVQIPSKKNNHCWKGKVKEACVQLLPYKMKKWLLIHIFKNKAKALKEFDFEMNTRSEHSMERYAFKNGLKIHHVAYTNSCEPDFGGNLMFRTQAEAADIPGYLSPMYFLQKQ